MKKQKIKRQLKIKKLNDNEQSNIFNTKSAEIKTLYKDEVPQYVNQAYENYVKNCAVDGIKIGEPYNAKDLSYDDLSDMIKKIIDGEFKIIKKELSDYILKLEDYKVPNDKILVVPGTASNVMEGQILKYNFETKKYHIYKNETFTNVSYEIEDLKNAEERKL